jgi:hypothetical protein
VEKKKVVLGLFVISLSMTCRSGRGAAQVIFIAYTSCYPSTSDTSNASSLPRFTRPKRLYPLPLSSAVSMEASAYEPLMIIMFSDLERDYITNLTTSESATLPFILQPLLAV